MLRLSAAQLNPADRRAGTGRFWALALGSIGVVFGDIGTSPLYAFEESIHHMSEARDGALLREDVLGIISLMVWSLIIVVTMKYVLLLLRLDNRGEGGTISLMALVQRTIGRRTPLLFVVALCGAGMFFGDALLTPAMSMLSAVEGLSGDPGAEGARRAVHSPDRAGHPGRAVPDPEARHALLSENCSGRSALSGS